MTGTPDGGQGPFGPGVSPRVGNTLAEEFLVPVVLATPNALLVGAAVRLGTPRAHDLDHTWTHTHPWLAALLACLLSLLAGMFMLSEGCLVTFGLAVWSLVDFAAIYATFAPHHTTAWQWAVFSGIVVYFVLVACVVDP